MNNYALIKCIGRFRDKIEDYSSNDKCWNWIGAKNQKGYGRFWFEGRFWGAHRFAYWFEYGYLTEGLQLDHLCRNPGCVNPSHLEEVDASTNILRGYIPNKEKTYCKNGHVFSEDNTYYYMWLGKTRRKCRMCQRNYYDTHRNQDKIRRAKRKI